MKARDLPAGPWTSGVITWEQNGRTHRSKPFAIEHAAGHVFLHMDGWSAHELRGDQDVEVTPQPPRKEG